MGEAKRREVLGLPPKGKRIEVDKSERIFLWLPITKSRIKKYPYMGVATMAIGAPGAFNAAIFAIQILALSDKVIGQKIQDWRNDITSRVKDEPE